MERWRGDSRLVKKNRVIQDWRVVSIGRLRNGIAFSCKASQAPGSCKMNGVSQVSSGEALPLLSEALDLSGTIRLQATGTSMVPAIQPRDILTIRPVLEHEVAVGDLVVFAVEQALVVHRVVRISTPAGERQLVTRGDRLLHDDAPISWSAVLGRVVQVERRKHIVKTSASAKRGQRALCQLLQRSDRATSLFLRATTLWNGLGSRGSMRRA